jgi:hypothetical protein
MLASTVQYKLNKKKHHSLRKVILSMSTKLFDACYCNRLHYKHVFSGDDRLKSKSLLDAILIKIQYQGDQNYVYDGKRENYVVKPFSSS